MRVGRRTRLAVEIYVGSIEAGRVRGKFHGRIEPDRRRVAKTKGLRSAQVNIVDAVVPTIGFPFRGSLRRLRQVGGAIHQQQRLAVDTHVVGMLEQR